MTIYYSFESKLEENEIRCTSFCPFPRRNYVDDNNTQNMSIQNIILFHKIIKKILIFSRI